MIVVYTAGKYRGSSIWETKQNIRAAEDVAVRLWKAGFAVICPHSNTNLFDGALGCPDSVWLDGDLEIITRCDMLVVLPNSENSAGTKAEIKLANELDMPVYYWENDAERDSLLNYFSNSSDTVIKGEKY